MRSVRSALLMIVVAVLPASGLAASARSLIQKGNRAFAEENFNTALERYREAAEKEPDSPYVEYNAGTALQKLAEHDKAIENFEKVYAREKPALGAWAFYNLGVSRYRQAEQAIAEQDIQKAVQLLKGCLEANRQAMRFDPVDPDPKFNYELAQRKLEELQQQQSGQQQSDQNQNEQNQDQPSPEKQPGGQEDQDQDPSRDDRSQQQDDQQQQNDQQQQGQQNEEPQDQQRQGEQDQTGENEQPSTQPEPGGDNQQQADSAGGDRQQPPQTPPGEMTPEDAKRLLNTLVDQDLRNLRDFLRRRSPRGAPTEKDW